MKRARQSSISLSRAGHSDDGNERSTAQQQAPVNEHQQKQCSQSHCNPRSRTWRSNGREYRMSRIFAAALSRLQRSLSSRGHLLWLVAVVLGTSLPVHSTVVGAHGAVGGNDRASLDFVASGSVHALRGLIVTGRGADEDDATVGTDEGRREDTGAGEEMESYVVVNGTSQVGDIPRKCC